MEPDNQSAKKLTLDSIRIDIAQNGKQLGSIEEPEEPRIPFRVLVKACFAYAAANMCARYENAIWAKGYANDMSARGTTWKEFRTPSSKWARSIPYHNIVKRDYTPAQARWRAAKAFCKGFLYSPHRTRVGLELDL